MLHFVMSYMRQNKNINKLSRVRNTDWKSALKEDWAVVALMKCVPLGIQGFKTVILSVQEET